MIRNPHLTLESEEALVTDNERLRSFRQLYEDHHAFVRKTLYWLVPHDLIDDLVQETFVRAWNNLSKFRNESSFKTWVHRIAINVAHDQNRRAKWLVFFGNGSDDEGAPIFEEPSVPSSETDLETRQLIRNGIQKLPMKLKTVFVLFYQQELSLEEIATTLKLSEGTVKSRLFNGRKIFTEYLKKNGVSYE